MFHLESTFQKYSFTLVTEYVLELSPIELVVTDVGDSTSLSFYEKMRMTTLIGRAGRRRGEEIKEMGGERKEKKGHEKKGNKKGGRR